MRVILAEKSGGPDVMRVADVETKTPTPGHVLVRVEAAGVNFIDVYHRTGQYPQKPPVPLGLEGAGVVEAIGDGVDEAKVGERVAWSSAPGSYATHVLVEASKTVPVPDGIDAKVAAAAMLQGMTAHYLAHDTFHLSKGDTCLVHAAAGGVGLLLVQMAKRAGARVFGTTSTDEKAKLARDAGADEVILYTKRDFAAEARRLTAGRGVDVVYDSVGKDTFEKSLASLRPRGMMVLFGQSSGAVPPIDPQILSKGGSLFLTRPTLVHYVATRAELLARAASLFGMIGRGELHVRIGATFPLERAADAHRALEGRSTTGKLLLLP